MNRNYLIDSENVGDAWIALLSVLDDSDRIFVFYTEHSPHMSYKNLIILKETLHEVLFVKCFEGSNALDFQLCTELGSLVRENPESEFVIVTNDTGFDAVTKYWGRKGKSVKRIKASDVKNERKNEISLQSPEKTCEPGSEQEREDDTFKESETVVLEEAEVLLPVPEGSPEEPAASADEKIAVPEEALEIFYCVGKENLLELHQALTLIYGANDGKALYNEFKNDSTYRTYLLNHSKLSTAEKCKVYCETVFSKAGVAMPEDFSVCLTESWKKKKNLNTLRAALMTKYGKGSFNTYYSLIRSHIRIIDKIR